MQIEEVIQKIRTSNLAAVRHCLEEWQTNSPELYDVVCEFFTRVAAYRPPKVPDEG
jgi:hypothetical protein